MVENFAKVTLNKHKLLGRGTTQVAKRYITHIVKHIQVM